MRKKTRKNARPKRKQPPSRQVQQRYECQTKPVPHGPAMETPNRTKKLRTKPKRADGGERSAGPKAAEKEDEVPRPEGREGTLQKKKSTVEKRRSQSVESMQRKNKKKTCMIATDLSVNKPKQGAARNDSHA